MKNKFALLWLLFALLFFSCATSQLERALDPDSKDFLSKVRYIISKEERDIFLKIGAADRKAFIEEFWKRRDPDPDTEVNEFKNEYFKRIDAANNLFREGGTPGWLQARGRVYITLGPPDNRERYPRGIDFYGKPTEIWYYGFFPFVFVDDNWSDKYELDPISVQQVTMLHSAQMGFKPDIPQGSQGKIELDFNLQVEKAKENDVLARIEIPYKNIWFRLKDRTFQTTLEVTLEIFDSGEKKIADTKKSYDISVAEKDFKEFVGTSYVIEVRQTLDPGNYTLSAEIKNETDGTWTTRKTKFTI